MDTTKDNGFSATAKRRGVKTYLLGKGIKFYEIRAHLICFLEHYGHSNPSDKTTDQLLNTASLFFKSLVKYTNGRIGKESPRGSDQG